MIYPSKLFLFELLIFVAVGVALPFIALGQATIGDVQSSLTQQLLDDPTYGWFIRSSIVVPVIIGVTQGFKTKVPRLRNDSDESAVALIVIALLVALGFGVVGLAPSTPVGGTMGGGFACWLVSVGGFTIYKRFTGASEERAARKTGELTPAPGVNPTLPPAP